MSFTITGLSPTEFTPLFDLPPEDLAARGIVEKTADAKPGFPCRVSLDDAEPGTRVLLFNYESHKAPTPYRSAYAIYISEGANKAAIYDDELPPVFANRPIALRIFDKTSMLIGADMGINDELKSKIDAAFANSETAYIHAHNAMHGCFAAEIHRRA